MEQYNSLQNEIVEQGYSIETLGILLYDIEKRAKKLMSSVEKERAILKDRILVYKLIINEMK